MILDKPPGAAPVCIRGLDRYDAPRMSPTLPLLLASGFGAGTAGALLGIGGGVLLVPLLTLGFHVPLASAVAASLVAVIGTSSGAASAYVTDRLCDVPLGMTLELATAAGAIAGALAEPFLPKALLRAVFALLLLYVAGLLAFGRSRAHDQEGAAQDYAVRRLPFGLGVSLLAGGLSGTLGIGGGPIKVPAMNLAMGVPFKVASATSNFMIGVTAAASVVCYYERGQIDLALAGPIAVGVVLGAMVGSRLMPHLQTRALKRVFSLVLAFAAIQMGLRAFGGAA